MAVITAYWTQDILLCLTAFFWALYVYVTRNFSYWKKMGIKEISPIPFFGNVAQLIFAQKHLPKMVEEAYSYGEGEQFVGLYSMDQPYLLIRDPELIRYVFIKDFNNFSNRIVATTDRDTMGNNTLFLTRNPPWRQIRQLLSPPLSTGRIKKMFPRMMAVSEDFETYMNTFNIDEKVGKSVEVKDICGLLATDFITSNAYSIRSRCLVNPKAEFRSFGKFIFCGGYYRYYRMLAMFYVPFLRHIFNPFFFDVATPFFRKTFWDSINYRMENDVKGNDMIDVLVELEKNQHKPDFDGLKLEGDKLVCQAGVYFTGGFETSATTITFALYEMAINPEIQETLRQEIFRAMDKEGGQITWDLVASLPYLHWCILETLRKWPVLAWLDRIAEEDYTFPGTDITIKKGTPVILPMRALQMDPKYFPDPDKFIPERWSEENKHQIVPYTFFPFGDGPRGCIGERLGLVQSKYGLLNFVSRFELLPTKETPIPMKLDITNLFLSTQGGLHLNLRKIVR